jgi:hypothetical protein
MGSRRRAVGLSLLARRKKMWEKNECRFKKQPFCGKAITTIASRDPTFFISYVCMYVSGKRSDDHSPEL